MYQTYVLTYMCLSNGPTCRSTSEYNLAQAEAPALAGVQSSTTKCFRNRRTLRPQFCSIFLEPPSSAQPIVAMASKASLLVGLLLLLSLLMCAQGEMPCHACGAYSSQFHIPQGGSTPFNFRWSLKTSSLDFCRCCVADWLARVP